MSVMRVRPAEAVLGAKVVGVGEDVAAPLGAARAAGGALLIIGVTEGDVHVAPAGVPDDAQVGPSDTTLARTLIEAVQEIINSLDR